MKRRHPSLSWVFPVRDDYVPMEGDVASDEGNEQIGGSLPRLLPSRDGWFLLRPEKRMRKWLGQNATLPEYRWRKFFAEKGPSPTVQGILGTATTQTQQGLLAPQPPPTEEEILEGIELEKIAEPIPLTEEEKKFEEYYAHYLPKYEQEDVGKNIDEAEHFAKSEKLSEQENEAKETALKDFLLMKSEALSVLRSVYDELEQQATRLRVPKEKIDSITKAKNDVNELEKNVRKGLDHLKTTKLPLLQLTNKFHRAQNTKASKEKLKESFKHLTDTQRVLLEKYIRNSSIDPLHIARESVNNWIDNSNEDEKVKEELREIIGRINRNLERDQNILTALVTAPKAKKASRKKENEIDTTTPLKPGDLVSIINVHGNADKRKYTIQSEPKPGRYILQGKSGIVLSKAYKRKELTLRKSAQ